MEQSVPLFSGRSWNSETAARTPPVPIRSVGRSQPTRFSARSCLKTFDLSTINRPSCHRNRRPISIDSSMGFELCVLIMIVGGGYSTIVDPARSSVDIRAIATSIVNNDRTKFINDDNGTNVFDEFFNSRSNNNGQRSRRYRIGDFENPERVLRSKVNVLAHLLKIHVDRLREKTNQVELVFLVDSSASVGLENFRSELNFVRKLLSDFTVEPAATRVALVTFAGRRHVRRHIDQISSTSDDDHKCRIFNGQLDNVTYTGGGTYTRGALLEALTILQNSREQSEKVVFLITDGFSNSGDPRPVAKHLKAIGATIFTFGIRTGNVEELHDIASEPGYTHSYLLDSFSEFEALARRALHRDLKTGRYVTVKNSNECNSLCSTKNNTEEIKECCDDLAICNCGTDTGHYACLCPRGYYGSGIRGSCQPCPNGTFDDGVDPIDSSTSCTPCPNVNHVTTKIPATSATDCVCAHGFITDGENCEAIRCPKLKVPENGYFVKASACSNVVNAACGLRCRIGFNLIGDSIRLCRKNGIWSGIEPQCLLKTCPALKAPTHGRIRCEHDENEKIIEPEQSTAHPMDTRCQFKCDNGYQLRGSKVRNCLPLSRWDGLKVTCKQIKCEPLRHLANGKITPEVCTGSKKLPFSTNCTFSCDDGFLLKGPKNRHCFGKNGVWSQRHSVNRCIDKTPPKITCPNDSTWKTLPGKNYAIVKWKIPEVSDNSNKVPNVWTKPHFDQPWKAKIGSHKIVYIAQDASGNKAKCTFVVRVIDEESPVVENCVDPPIFLTVNKIGVENVTWQEPIFHDNSERSLTIARSHSTPNCACSIGITKIFYNATDASDNFVSCVLNITVEDACKDVPVVSNGRTNCRTIEGQAVRCMMTCEEGYGFAIDGQTDVLDSDNSIVLTCGLNDSDWNSTFFPDCSATEIPKSIGRDGSVILRGNTSFCDNKTTIRQLSDRITEDLSTNMIDICGNDIDCSVVKLSNPECVEEIIEHGDSNLKIVDRSKRYLNDIESRIKRVASKVNDGSKKESPIKRKRAKVEMKFRFVAKIVTQYRNNVELGMKKLREKIQTMTATGQLNLLNNRTNREIAKLALNLKTVFEDARELCEPGSVLKKHNCTKCPVGTFHNETRDHCQACKFGEYQNSTGSSHCEKCPRHTSTRKMHSKNSTNCIPLCRPGYFSRRKSKQPSTVGLEPCATCDVGFYQNNYGKKYCEPCPDDKTTDGRGKTRLEDCFSSSKPKDPCTSSPCSNGGRCIFANETLSCECSEYYVGSTCEKLQDPCDSQPCLNEGECNALTDNEAVPSYSCNCKSGFTGKTCENYIDECSSNPCKNGGSCVSTEQDYSCICKNGFEGNFCERNADHCESNPCEEGSTCSNVDDTWKCTCAPGFLGLRCNLLACDWIPCHKNAVCLNFEETNATRDSYRCVCPDGYEGDDCAIRINHCESLPCLNHGNCINGIFNYTCDCPINYVGINCEIELSPEYVLQFSNIGSTDYVIMKGPKKNLTELTVCLWLQSVDKFNYGTVLSYATKYQDNVFTLTDYNGFVLYVNGEKIVTDITVNDGNWHFFCVDWTTVDGTWHAYVDGLPIDNGTLLAKQSFIPGNGEIVIGQEQDRLGGGFSASEAFLGKMGYLDIWDTIIGEDGIKNLSSTCERYHGSIVAWGQVRRYVRGSVSILNDVFCRGCPLPLVPSNGHVNLSNDGSDAFYFCKTGYLVKVGNWIGKMYKRSCRKYGEWEGYDEPTCTKVKCGFPGYFPRGRVHGRSFVYGDEVRYSCAEGYELRGNPRRVCNADGRWRGLQPICIGVTCKNLLAPENGDIEYVIEEHERDDVSILQVGQQLEFKCDPGFRLSGERYLTCLESGKWDFERPDCVPSGCPAPKMLRHGYISTNQFAMLPIYRNFNESAVSSTEKPTEDNNDASFVYSFGDIIGLSCHEGYKFAGNENLIVEFRLQCSINGNWTGSVPRPDCVRRRCSSPEPVKNGKIIIVDDAKIARRSTINDDTKIRDTDKNDTEDSNDYDNNDDELKLFTDLLREDETIDDVEEIIVPGMKIMTSCDRGYKLNGEATRICLNDEKWSSNDPRCERIYCPIENHAVLGSLLARKLNETTIMLVNEEQRDDEREEIVKFRDAIGGDTNFTYEGSHYGDKIVFTCVNDGNFISEILEITEDAKNLTWKCDEDGKWKNENERFNESAVGNIFTEKINICRVITCGSPQIPSNGYIANADNTSEEIKNWKVNETAIFRCRGGFDLRGSDTATCLTNGSWSAVVPSCTPVACKNPPKIANAVVDESTSTASTNDDYVFGNTIAYKCITGYRIFGRGMGRCLANGKWSKIHGKCSKISCGKPKIPPGVIVYGRSYLFQEQLSYKCPGEGPRGSITCGSDGKWSDPPVCAAKQR